jgi:hypothetical protein
MSRISGPAPGMPIWNSRVIAAASEVILFAISSICRISGYCNTDGSPWALSWVWRSMTSVVAIENQHLRMRSLPRAWRTAAQRSA